MEPKLIDGIHVNDAFVPIDDTEYQVVTESVVGGRTYVLLSESRDSPLLSAAAGTSKKVENQFYVLKSSEGLQQLSSHTLYSPDSETEGGVFFSSNSSSSAALSMSEEPPSPAPEGVESGRDPVPELASNLADPSLLYGLAEMRDLTLLRLQVAGGFSDTPTLSMIDQYNKDIGIKDLMGSKFMPSEGLFMLREQLKHPEEWKASPSISTNPRLMNWIDILVENRENIGLEDFGNQEECSEIPGEIKGALKISSKNRLTKNLPLDLQGKITSKEINHFLRPDQTLQSAQAEFELLSEEQQEALVTWIYLAFFRRTSKLGIDFAVNKLGANIHFNIAGAIDHKSTDPNQSKITAGGLVLNAALEHKIDRAITVSELRHVDKAIQQGTILPSSVNKYNEVPNDIP